MNIRGGCRRSDDPIESVVEAIPCLPGRFFVDMHLRKEERHGGKKGDDANIAEEPVHGAAGSGVRD